MTREYKVKLLIWSRGATSDPLVLEWWSLEARADDILTELFTDPVWRKHPFKRVPLGGLHIVEGTLEITEDDHTFYVNTRQLSPSENTRIGRNNPIFREPGTTGYII